MRIIILAGLAAFALAIPGAAAAQQGRAKPLFQCTLANGKTLAVTARGDEFTYRYGSPRRAELILTATPRSGTARHLQQRYYAIATQIRFSSGEYSYIVHEIPSSTIADARGTSGLMVLRGNRVIADHKCRRLTEFRDWESVRRLPEDEERWSAMALEE
jgi:hypothetical protein